MAALLMSGGEQAARRQGRRAQSLVEFALTIPLFLVLMLGFIDFCRVLFVYESLVDSASTAARMSAIPTHLTTPANVLNAFNNTAMTLSGQNGTVTYNFFKSGHTPENTSPPDLTTGACAVPLATGTCTLPATSSYTTALYAQGVVQVVATYTFYYLPLFTGPFGVGLLNPSSQFTYTAMAYIG